MDERFKVAAPESVVTDSKRWFGAVLSAVILGEGIWSLLVLITHNLAVPALARVMGGDPQSPLYLGKGDYDVPALLISVLEACFAGIVAVVVYSWSQKSGRTRVIRVASAASSKSVSIVPPSAPQASPTSIAPPAAPRSIEMAERTSPTTEVPSAPATPRPVQSAPQAPAPAKRKKPKQVYYNSVGEPIEDDEE